MEIDPKSNPNLKICWSLQQGTGEAKTTVHNYQLKGTPNASFIDDSQSQNKYILTLRCVRSSTEEAMSYRTL